MYALCKRSSGSLRGRKNSEENIFFPPENMFTPEFMLPEVYTKKMKLGEKKKLHIFRQVLI